MPKRVNFRKLLSLPRRLAAREILLLFAPIALFLSYHPMISFGEFSAMHAEISISEIYLLVFAICNLSAVWRARKTLIKNRALWLVGAIAIVATLSILWSPNPLRGLLTVGIMWLIVVSFAGVLTIKIKQLLPALGKILIASSAFFSIVGWVQVWADTLGVPPNITEICAGCRASGFGFARVTGFAIEPQFFGSLLLAPILLLMQVGLNGKFGFRRNVILGFLTATMILTLSRGAIYALVIGAVVLFVVNFRQVKRILTVAGICAIGATLAFLTQGAMSLANPNTSDNFADGVARSLNQLSMGVIDIRRAKSSENSEKPAAKFDGYVEKSTNERVNMTNLAIDTWTDSPANLIFGVGVGGSGRAMSAATGKSSELEITQNEYTEVLLENGLIGMMLFAAMIVSFFRGTRQTKLAWAIMIAFLVQWWFFSGYPNALHIYFALIILWALRKVSLRPCTNFVKISRAK